MHLGPSKRCRIIRVVGLTVVKCRINRGEIHGIDREFGGTEDKLSDHPCCRINRGRINRVALYVVKCWYGERANLQQRYSKQYSVP